MNRLKLIPKNEAGIQEPKGGWKANTWYLVEMSMNANNPVFFGMFFSGFLNKGKPAGYHGAFPIYTPDHAINLREIYYLKVVKKVFANSEVGQI